VNTVTLPDEVELDIDSYNRRVITKSFNQVVCERLAEHIDPGLQEKTIVFCVTDGHADMVVALLKEAFDRKYGGVDDDAARAAAVPRRPARPSRRPGQSAGAA
jgi:type I restriction enzyme, R subunit